MSALVDRITEVQRKHREDGWIANGGEPYCCCSCKWIGPDHPAHVADQVAALLTEEWSVQMELDTFGTIRCEPTPFPPRGELAHTDVVFSRWVSEWTEVDL